MPTSLIFGIDGQVGSYLAELLLDKGYHVVGWVPATVPVSLDNVKHIRDHLTIIDGDLADLDSVCDTIAAHKPDEVYNLAAPSFPAGSWDQTLLTADIAGLGVARLLEAIRELQPSCRFYQASTSELFGDPLEVPQDEDTPFRPRNPYGAAKLYAHWTTIHYRQHFDLFAVSGIMYNTESPRRGEEFVTRKITAGAARISLGIQSELRLGNLDARRDWGYAGDYVRALWLMLQANEPEDYVIGTGVTHSVREFCELAFAAVDLDYNAYVVQDERFMRPDESAQLVANPRKAHRQLGWEPQMPFDDLVRTMVHADLQRLKAIS